MNAAELFVKALENEGVEYVFGIPGEENLDILEALGKSSIRLILTRHEQAAGFMAATIGRLTGKPGVALSTLGPGATNFVTATAYAHLGAMPAIFITGQKPIMHSKQGRFQIIDTVAMMKPITKQSVQIVSANNTAAVVREAFKIAESERPGPVHIELPEDIAGTSVARDTVYTIRQVRRPAGEEKAVRIAADRIKAAKSPVLVIGAGANRKRVTKSLTEFVNVTGIPFITTQMGKGIIDETHPLAIGCAALSDKDFLHCVLKKADLIINVGHDVIEKPPFFMTDNGAEVIHVHYYESGVDPVYFPQYQLIGDIGNSIWQLTQSLGKLDIDVSYALKTRQQAQEQMLAKNDDDRFPLIPQRIVADTRSSVPKDGIVSLDNGMYKIWFARMYPCYEPNTLLLDNALATMGAGLPAAMAAKMVHPEKVVVAICGDGGFMMNSQEIETAVRLGLHIVVVILNDSGYGMIKWKQADSNYASQGLDFGNPDFVKYAESYGAKGHRVTHVSEYAAILQQAIQEPGVHIIDLPVDYSENALLSEELKSRSCA